MSLPAVDTWLIEHICEPIVWRIEYNTGYTRSDIAAVPFYTGSAFLFLQSYLDASALLFLLPLVVIRYIAMGFIRTSSPTMSRFKHDPKYQYARCLALFFSLIGILWWLCGGAQHEEALGTVCAVVGTTCWTISLFCHSCDDMPPWYRTSLSVQFST
jgi:hypothetical protein